MILYHGSPEIVEYPEIRISKFHKDFYYGFYTIAIFKQAVRWAIRFSGSGYVNHYEYTPDSNLRQLIFPEMTEEWLDFIISCRLGQSHDYDIVEGPMANDTIYNYVQDYIDGSISRAAFWELAKFKYPTHQTSFHTARALETIKFVRAEIVGNADYYWEADMLDNDLFYTCSLIEYIGRLKKQPRGVVVSALGTKALRRIYTYADVLHCDTIENVADKYSEMAEIPEGSFDNVKACQYDVPSYWDIGKVFARLVEDVSPNDPVSGIEEVYGSWITDAISNYNSDLFYQSREYLKECYLAGKILY